mmetsp:Transcript_15438/g.22407  ORF Transcript_15438/g.22407 Transcript_15438/m.22407 type:complete len:122 (+) Transcript_15438:26-391(+)
MASVARDQLSKSEHDELACVFSALILQDEGTPITADRLEKLLTASGNKLDKYWPTLFANAVKGLDLETLIAGVGSGSAAASAGPAQGTTAAPQAAEEEKPEEDEEEAMEGAMDLFGGDDDW